MEGDDSIGRMVHHHPKTRALLLQRQRIEITWSVRIAIAKGMSAVAVVLVAAVVVALMIAAAEADTMTVAGAALGEEEAITIAEEALAVMTCLEALVVPWTIYHVAHVEMISQAATPIASLTIC